MDGNGRIGRLLIPLFLYSREFIQYPLLYISEYFERQRKQYLDFLHGVDEKSDWNTWLKFFLIALESQALRTQETVFSILNLYDELKGKITTVNSVYAIHLLDVIFITPIVTSATIRRRLKGCSGQTVYNLVRKFVDVGILSEVSGRKRNRMFVFQKLLNILK